MKAELGFLDAFPHGWSVELLNAPPLIAPARQYVYPLRIAGEEDALGRGALLLMVRPASGGAFLATCALGFTDASMPTGVYACPNADEVCAVAGGYAYVIDTLRPERTVHIPLKPVASVRVLEAHGLLLFVGFHSIVGGVGGGWFGRHDGLVGRGFRWIRLKGIFCGGSGGI
jgi:hypothetical protein